MPQDKVDKVEAFCLAIPRDTPYLGPLERGTAANSKGYFVRPGNRSIYSLQDHSVLVKVTTADGLTGWGESYGIVAPEVVRVILEEILVPVVLGRNPEDAAVIQEDLYDMMRVRGFFGAFYMDAIAALDIALWDVKGKRAGVSLATLLGGRRHEQLPAYVSGLPKATREERVALAKAWQAKGFNAFKFAAAVASDGEVAEMRSLREALGDEVDLLIDMHWRYTALEAIRLINQLQDYTLYLAEAPCNSEDIEGQAQVARSVGASVALGEELRTVYEYRPRFVQRCMNIIQPEIAHMGVTQFARVCQMAVAFHCKVIPHASIGIGVFQAASLQVTATLPNAPYHEYQHSIFDKNLRFVTGDMRCEAGYFSVPTGPGIGVEPTAEIFNYLKEP